MQIVNKAPAAATSTSSSQMTNSVAREELLRSLPHLTARGVVVVGLVIAVYVWGLRGTNIQPGELARGVPNIVNFFVRLMPPAFDLQPVADLPQPIHLPFTIAGTSMEEEAAALTDEQIVADMPDWYKQAAAEADGSVIAPIAAEPDSVTPKAEPANDAPAVAVTPNWFEWKPSTINKIFVPAIIPAVIQTLQMAIIGTTLSIFFAIPFGLLAARNISPHPVIYQVVRFIMNIIRSVPEIIIALVFVAAVGLGPFGGVMALGIAAIGSVARLYAESIEQIDPQQMLAVRATGANGLQVFTFGVVPQILPLVMSYSLSLFEHNLRAASILGLVGAGGAGFLLSKYMALFQYQQLMGAVIILVFTVTVVDRVSAHLRRAII